MLEIMLSVNCSYNAKILHDLGRHPEFYDFLNRLKVGVFDESSNSSETLPKFYCLLGLSPPGNWPRRPLQLRPPTNAELNAGKMLQSSC